MALRIGMIGVVRRPTAAVLLLAAGTAVAAEILPPAPARPLPPPAPAPVDLPPELVADFTRRVQPLVLNRCAAGACHGGPRSPEPRFIRPDARGGIDHRSTQANLQSLLAAVGGDRDASGLAALLAAGHPADPVSARLVAQPLSPRERVNLEHWLAGVQLAERRTIVDPAVRQAGVSEPAARRPNRFRAMLESAANPPEFPPPEQPRGVIFPRDVPPDD